MHSALPTDQQTQLTATIENFPTETIRKHLGFYWRATIVMIKKAVEIQVDHYDRKPAFILIARKLLLGGRKKLY